MLDVHDASLVLLVVFVVTRPLQILILLLKKRVRGLEVVHDKIQIFIPLDSCSIVLVDHGAFQHLVERLLLLGRELELKLLGMGLLDVLVCLRFSDGLDQKVKSNVMAILSKTALNDGVVSDVIWLYILMDHLVEHLDGLIDHVGLNACLNHTREDEDTRFDTFSLHLVKDPKSFIDMPHPLVDLGED